MKVSPDACSAVGISCVLIFCTPIIVLPSLAAGRSGSERPYQTPQFGLHPVRSCEVCIGEHRDPCGRGARLQHEGNQSSPGGPRVCRAGQQALETGPLAR